MADRPGRRRLPFPLSNRRSAQINKQEHPGNRPKRQILSPGAMRPSLDHVLPRNRQRPTSPTPTNRIGGSPYINKIRFYIN